MRVVIRMFNKDGYHKDVVIMSEQQVHSHDSRVEVENSLSCMTGLIGVVAGFNPSDFPEAVRFEVVIPVR